MTTLTGRGISVFQAATLKSALQLYTATGGKVIPTRGVGPKRMMALATQITGKSFKPRDYPGAIKALGLWIEVEKMMAIGEGGIQ